MLTNCALLMTHMSCCQALESKLLVGGKNIIDHTNEQQKMLELKRQEITEQVIHTHTHTHTHTHGIVFDGSKEPS